MPIGRPHTPQSLRSFLFGVVQLGEGDIECVSGHQASRRTPSEVLTFHVIPRVTATSTVVNGEWLLRLLPSRISSETMRRAWKTGAHRHRTDDASGGWRPEDGTGFPARHRAERLRFFLDDRHPAFARSGLKKSSVIKGEKLALVHRAVIHSTIGTLPLALLEAVVQCVHAAIEPS